MVGLIGRKRDRSDGACLFGDGGNKAGGSSDGHSGRTSQDPSTSIADVGAGAFEGVRQVLGIGVPQ